MNSTSQTQLNHCERVSSFFSCENETKDKCQIGAKITTFVVLLLLLTVAVIASINPSLLSLGGLGSWTPGFLVGLTSVATAGIVANTIKNKYEGQDLVESFITPNSSTGLFGWGGIL